MNYFILQMMGFCLVDFIRRATLQKTLIRKTTKDGPERRQFFPAVAR
jgi:hypothetical protein